MAGRGPRPKDADRLAGHGAAKARSAELRVYTADPASQPPLPPRFAVNAEGRKKRVAWPAVTRRWWATWGAEPMTAEFRPTDWDFLLDTALLHAQVWGDGDMRGLAELRLRVAKMGATSEDRARLRIVYAQADEAEEKRDRKSSTAAPKAYERLRAVD
ncbi:MAG: hypothetical protein KDB47_17780 [Mycobacterium sp.]|nr:hypothetical protein [Mycobacterium sp.]